MEGEVRKAFLNRPRLAEKAPGFCYFDVLTDAADPAIFLLLTRWTDDESFRSWHQSEAHHQSHELIPQGLKLDAPFTSLTIANSIDDPAGTQDLMGVVEGRTVAISEWLTESDSVFALVLAQDGTIRSRNRAAFRVFPPDPSKDFGLTIWDYLVCSDALALRQRLSEPGGQYDGCMLLNLADGEQNPITLEVGLVRCNGVTLLLGTMEYRHEANFRTEISKLTSDLAVMMRDATQKNRALKEANETVERLARTDALTGLANRRTLDETLPREIARAGRLGEHLSLIIADLDHFKSINDQYGHLAGDQVLASAAAVFGSRLRSYDLAARYGGEEFVILLPGASAEDAFTIAERARKDVEKIDAPGCPTQITASFGVASWIAGEASEEFVARADTALYNAKNGGRNRVESASAARV
jgi:diguanylate cyclase (GGDEF)-like protein